jgi:hypothetical protein
MGFFPFRESFCCISFAGIWGFIGSGRGMQIIRSHPLKPQTLKPQTETPQTETPQSGKPQTMVNSRLREKINAVWIFVSR